MTRPMTRLPAKHSRAMVSLCSTLPRGFLLCIALLTGLLLIAGVTHRTGHIIGNASSSVPRGLYLRADPDRASYVTFCLGNRHKGLQVGSDLCSPDRPDGKRIIKRIVLRIADGSLTVAGDTPRALDSRFLGPVHPDEIQGWWVPLLTEPAHAQKDPTP